MTTTQQQEKPHNKREIVYDDGFCWKIERVDGGMGEHDYNILMNSVFYARTEHLETATAIVKHLIHRRPNEQAIRQDEREKVLDEATGWLFEQFKQFTNGNYVFGSDWLADWWIERIGYLRTPEGRAELRQQQERERG